MAAVDVREGAVLSVQSTLLTRGRTSGIYCSAGAAVLLGPGNFVTDMGLAALEVATCGQVLCSTAAVAMPFLDSATKYTASAAINKNDTCGSSVSEGSQGGGISCLEAGSTSIERCKTVLLVSSGGCVGALGVAKKC